jgi:hypothetical protein
MVERGNGACIRPAVAVRTALILSVCLVGQVWLSADEKESILEYSYSGSGPAAREFARVMERRAVQSALLAVAAAPRTRAFLDAALKDGGVDVEQLQTLGLIRIHGDQYELAFSLLTQEDREKIRAVAEGEGRRLASDLLAYRSRIEDLLASGGIAEADRRAMAYFILGCVSLDWDGLNLVAEKGYLTVPAEGSYLPTAYQPPPRDSIRQLYWGSHNNHDPIAVTTFGDHYSLPRLGLPDVLWTLGVEAPEPVRSKTRRVAQGLVRRHAAALVLALRDGAKSAGQLATNTGIDGADVKDTLDLLAALDYVRETEAGYQALVPVLAERDRSMVRQLRLLGRQVMLKWFDERYRPLCDELAELTPSRYGVPLSNSFYWVWHYLFGMANRELVAAGLFADPYDPKRRFQGFIPAIYQLDVVQGPL